MTQAPAHIPIDAIRNTALRADAMRVMGEFFAESERLIAAQPATCWNKGECCQFGTFGHRLYVTTLEAAWYAAQGGTPTPTADACPHAYDGKCHVRERRPLGCRVFYCDKAAQHWQGPLMEERLKQLRVLHDSLDVPYVYADWMHVLQALSADAGHVAAMQIHSQDGLPDTTIRLPVLSSNAPTKGSTSQVTGEAQAPAATRKPHGPRRSDRAITATLVLWAVAATSWVATPATRDPLAPVLPAKSTIDPNVAPWWELATLPRIGRATAMEIIAYRNAWAPDDDVPYRAFAAAADLQKVKGIGPKTVQRLMEHLNCGDAAPSRSLRDRERS